MKGNRTGGLAFHTQPFFIRFARLLIMCLLCTIVVVLWVNNWEMPVFGIPSWLVILPIGCFFLIENAVKMWGAKAPAFRIVCYVLDILCLLVLTLFSDGTLISTLYIIVLSEFYLNQERFSDCIVMCVSSLVVFLVTFAVTAVFRNEGVNIVRIVTSSFNDLMLLVLHFFIVNFAIQIYRKNKELREALAELHKSNEKLRHAYEELQEITALEERQRIAKDIHDTAGHSITTVIMQTEAAKLVIDRDPAEAKQKITAANLQAKHALEELRESVHLLSGMAEQQTLREMLIAIIHDSTDGTGINIRYEIDDVKLCDSKQRFLCNTLKEGISNGLRHGGATAFWFELKRRGDRVEFLLSDNGRGQSIGALKEGFGLTGMHVRAESLGGSVWFETEPDEGFEIHLSLPTDREEGDNT